MGMKWHKFQVYFNLWLSSVYGVLTGFAVISGLQYGDMADEVYSYMEGLKTIDVIYGVLLIGLAVWAVVTRFHLAAMRKTGIKCLLNMYWLNLAVELFYVVAAGMMAGAVLETLTEMASNLAAIVLAYAINRAYYAKREHLFTEA